MIKMLFFCMMLVLVAISKTQAEVQSVFDLPKPEPVMNKLYATKNDFVLSTGYFPMNSFSKYFLVGASYTRFFNDTHGWEVLNAQMAMEQPTTLKSDLLNPSSGYQNVAKGRAIISDDFANLQYSLSTSYIYSPFYMKSLFFNSSQVHMRLSLLLGLGIAQFQILTSPMANAALIQKFIFQSGNAFSFEVRYLSFFSTESTVNSNFALNLGYVWSWGRQ